MFDPTAVVGSIEQLFDYYWPEQETGEQPLEELLAGGVGEIADIGLFGAPEPKDPWQKMWEALRRENEPTYEQLMGELEERSLLDIPDWWSERDIEKVRRKYGSLRAGEYKERERDELADLLEELMTIEKDPTSTVAGPGHRITAAGSFMNPGGVISEIGGSAHSITPTGYHIWSPSRWTIPGHVSRNY